MTCSKCKKRTTQWQLDFYAGICAYCSMRKEQGNPQPVMGVWNRRAASELRHFEKDVLQPKNKDGTFNKKFVQAYGTKRLEKEYKTNAREIEKVTY